MKAKKCSNCPYVGVLFKSKPALCRNCAMEYNYQNKEKVAQKGLNKARTPIKKVSDKQAKINAAYSVLRKQFLKDNPTCKVCGRESKEVHHKLGRLGHRMLDTTEWLSVCSLCHHDIEMNPEWAKLNGYSKNRLDK